MDGEHGDIQGTPPLKSMLFSPTPSAAGALVKMLVASKNYHVAISINIHVVGTDCVMRQEYGVAC